MAVLLHFQVVNVIVVRCIVLALSVGHASSAEQITVCEPSRVTACVEDLRKMSTDPMKDLQVAEDAAGLEQKCKVPEARPLLQPHGSARWAVPQQVPEAEQARHVRHGPDQPGQQHPAPVLLLLLRLLQLLPGPDGEALRPGGTPAVGTLHGLPEQQPVHGIVREAPEPHRVRPRRLLHHYRPSSGRGALVRTAATPAAAAPADLDDWPECCGKEDALLIGVFGEAPEPVPSNASVILEQLFLILKGRYVRCDDDVSQKMASAVCLRRAMIQQNDT
ncbi:uncharacterized protein LOC119183840 isoform X1 [Rhipicephalus microplus]|uniref:uncharacterized protein LOC119183840 isoform X1 n=1 Tax=Rhipicephalus microplus TaxID=6941 RepID=UPI003F6D0FDD